MKLTPIKGIFALLVGVIVLKIFFPWWFVTIVIGGATCLALYKWVIKKTGVSPGWAKALAGIAISVFCISLLLTYTEVKTPWIAKAFDSRQLFASLGIADWLDPKYPVGLSVKLAKFKEFMVKAEEQKYIKKIELIEAKIAEGKELSPEDEMIIKEAEEKLKELDKKMSGIRLSRPPNPKKTPSGDQCPALPGKESNNKQVDENLQKNQVSPSSSPKPPELAFLGKDVKYVKFEENKYIARSPEWVIKVASAQIIQGGKLKLNFLHIAGDNQTYSKPGLVWIESPESMTYLLDDLGRKINFVAEENLGIKTDKSGKTYLGGNVLPSGVPFAYSLIFSRPAENIREISFVSKYLWCSAFAPSVCIHTEHKEVVIKGIKLFIEKSQLAEMNQPFSEDRPAEVLARTVAQEETENRVLQEENEKQVSEEEKPSQSPKTIRPRTLREILRERQRLGRYPYRR